MLEDRRTGFESARGYLYIPYRLGTIRALVALEEAQDMTPFFIYGRSCLASAGGVCIFCGGER